jgi:hypothetical protein
VTAKQWLLYRATRSTGARILACFGAIWYAFADLFASPTIPLALAWAVPGVIVLALLMRAAARLRALDRAAFASLTWGEPETNERRAVDRRFVLVNLVEFVAIVLAIVAANVLHVPERIPGLVAILVGLHFLPLASLFRVSAYYFTGIAMCAGGVVSFAWNGTPAPLFAAECLILWVTAAYVLAAAYRLKPAKSIVLSVVGRQP